VGKGGAPRDHTFCAVVLAYEIVDVIGKVLASDLSSFAPSSRASFLARPPSTCIPAFPARCH